MKGSISVALNGIFPLLLRNRRRRRRRRRTKKKKHLTYNA
jgi:hypothetical protein